MLSFVVVSATDAAADVANNLLDTSRVSRVPVAVQLGEYLGFWGGSEASRSQSSDDVAEGSWGGLELVELIPEHARRYQS